MFAFQSPNIYETVHNLALLCEQMAREIARLRQIVDSDRSPVELEQKRFYVIDVEVKSNEIGTD